MGRGGSRGDGPRSRLLSRPVKGEGAERAGCQALPALSEEMTQVSVTGIALERGAACQHGHTMVGRRRPVKLKGLKGVNWQGQECQLQRGNS